MIKFQRYMQSINQPTHPRFARLFANGFFELLLVLVAIVGFVVLPSEPVYGMTDDGATDTSQPIMAISWSQTAQQYRGQTEDVVLYCSGNGQLGKVWGSDVYADDSSICSAAVHGGLITVEDGGAIAIRILPGQSKYISTTQNDVTSDAWGSWFGSFTFTTLYDPIAGVVEVEGQSVPIQVASWQTTAEQFAGRGGDAIALYCPPNGELGDIWGTGVYRDSSSVCSAAVHDGRLTVADGGAIAFYMQPGQTSYRASTSQGMTSRSFGRGGTSFQFVPFQ